jgi:hypothetical protein
MNLGAHKCIAIILMFPFKKKRKEKRKTLHILIAKVYHMFSAGKFVQLIT